MNLSKALGALPDDPHELRATIVFLDDDRYITFPTLNVTVVRSKPRVAPPTEGGTDG